MAPPPTSRVPQDHALIGRASDIPVNEASPVISISPVVLPTPARTVDLQMRITTPVTGSNLPVILLSHGHGKSNNLSSLNGYGPLANFWAAHGFAVIQPTHLSSKSLSLDSKEPGAPLFWRSRVQDMKTILDRLDEIEDVVPHLKGRLDREQIAIVGHSLGGHTASMLLGGQTHDPNDITDVNVLEKRFKAGIVIAAPGVAGDSAGPLINEMAPFLKDLDFTNMTTPALVVVGDADDSPHLSSRGPEYHADPYFKSSGPKSLLTMVGGKHSLGGISGYDANEAADEDPERLACVQRLTWAYLRSALIHGDSSWKDACAVLEKMPEIGRVESR